GQKGTGVERDGCGRNGESSRVAPAGVGNRSYLCGKNAKCRIAQEQGAFNNTGCAVGGHLTQHVNIDCFRPGRWSSDTEEGATPARDRARNPTNSQTPAGPAGGASQRPGGW